MTAVGDGFSTGPVFRPFPRPIQKAWRTLAFQRLNRALETAVPVPFDDTSRLIFFSDCHRGDNSPADAFARNKPIYLAALTHYFDEGYTYIEVGDGDELWFNGRFSDIVAAHRDIFDLLHRYDDDERLYLLIGNHDTYNAFRHQGDKDGLPTYHSLLLTHRLTQRSLLVAHGHQADLTSSRYYTVTRVAARSFRRWAHLRDILTGAFDVPADSGPDATLLAANSRFAGQGKRIEQRIVEWIQQRQIPVICGHTHLMNMPGPAAPPYFNTGCCVRPGYITGLELCGGELSLIKWSLDSHGNGVRHRLAAPRAVASLLAPGAVAA
jgi:UDP-2,3-diacylglucosamine pyrophosphatase LpxH